MSKLINKEALRQSLIKVKQYIDDKLFGNSESLKDLISEEISKGLSTIVDSAPETLDTLKEVAEYIAKDEQHAVEVTTTLSNHESAIQSLQTDSVIGKGEADNSAVLKGEYGGYSNKAISQTSMAIGAATTAGLKGWYYSAIDFANKTITLSDKPTYILVGGILLNGGWSSGKPNIKRDDVISLVNNSKYDFCSKVTTINDNVITVDSLPFTELVKDNGASVAVLAGQFSDGYSIYIPERPDAGLIDFGGGAFSEGSLSKATNIAAHAEGLETHAYGHYSHTEGRDTMAGYAAHAEGYTSLAVGCGAHSEGMLTKAIGAGAHSEGYRTIAKAGSSHAEGSYTETKNSSEHAEGKYNVSNEGKTIHSVGIGTSDKRRNAHEIMQDGKHYVYGVGGYNGTNPDNSEDLATVIAKGGGGITNVTYDELVSLRDNSQLKAGMFYRITDYVTTTIQENTQSAGHAFDVIVIATDSKTLSEEARAIAHDFSNILERVYSPTLESECQYRGMIEINNTSCLLFNAEGCQLAIDVKKHHVIYNENDTPEIEVDYARLLENEQWSEWYDNTGEYIRFEYENPDNLWHFSTSNLAAWKVWYCLDNDATRFAWADAENGKGVIYRLIDEWNNDIPYDFKNIRFSGEYTFANADDLTGNSRENSIRAYFNNNKFLLNKIRFGTYCYNNMFDCDCYNNTLGNSCKYNSFGPECKNNKLYYGCQNNTFAYNCYNNTLNYECKNNKFEHSCFYNTLDYRCTSNSFGSSCGYNDFGSSCGNNSFGDGCNNNKLGVSNSYNIFGIECDNNKFINSNNTTRKYVKYNTFGNNCSSVILQNDDTESSSNYIQNYRIANGMTGTVEVTRGLAYETTIAKATDGTIKQFNLADLAN